MPQSDHGDLSILFFAHAVAQQRINAVFADSVSDLFPPGRPVKCHSAFIPDKTLQGQRHAIDFRKGLYNSASNLSAPKRGRNKQKTDKMIRLPDRGETGKTVIHPCDVCLFAIGCFFENRNPRANCFRENVSNSSLTCQISPGSLFRTTI